jgi:hypothetical protein
MRLKRPHRTSRRFSALRSGCYKRSAASLPSPSISVHRRLDPQWRSGQFCSTSTGSPETHARPPSSSSETGPVLHLPVAKADGGEPRVRCRVIEMKLKIAIAVDADSYHPKLAGAAQARVPGATRRASAPPWSGRFRPILILFWRTTGSAMWTSRLATTSEPSGSSRLTVEDLPDNVQAWISLAATVRGLHRPRRVVWASASGFSDPLGGVNPELNRRSHR